VAAAMAPVVAFAGGGAGLVKGGRLVFLFPTHLTFSGGSGAGVAGEVVDEEAGRQRRREQLLLALPRHPALRLVALCTQEFKGMFRHAVVMERV